MPLFSQRPANSKTLKRAPLENIDGYQLINFYSSSSNHRLDITLLRLQRHCLVPRRRHPDCESTHCEGK
ncbi:hypothetical protein J6590_082602 [Homalodisca vitripennis]|nr:hypothetical protein J6590_082602 [Homalodisca vitripennis]